MGMKTILFIEGCEINMLQKVKLFRLVITAIALLCVWACIMSDLSYYPNHTSLGAYILMFTFVFWFILGSIINRMKDKK